ncbi:MAG: hypothetical protein M1838_005988 [Thelocarpon superellum]|nr:MAG: hypothetical protein M1838_005988 [Thelocarpon superellum]
MPEAILAYGFTAVPRNVDVLLQGQTRVHAPKAVLVADVPLPDTPLAAEVLTYAQTKLPVETYNHSMRVYYFGKAIAHEQFPDWSFSDETYLLTALLHDIGTTATNLRASLMSFEFYGGLLALELLHSELHAPKAQAESVAEAIFRHQDLGGTGSITTVGQLIQLATILDNMGEHSALVHPDTIKDVTAHFPRRHWSLCFAATIREENRLKPWAHTTALGPEDSPTVCWAMC